MMTRSEGSEDGIRVAVSTVILTLRRDGTAAPRIALPLVRRTREPHAGAWALPGGWLDTQEGLAAAAARTLAETTGLAPGFLEQLYAFGAVDRSPSRVISVVYWALLREDLVDQQLAAHRGDGTGIENVAWFDAADLPGLAFDHADIVEYALWRLRNKAGYSKVAQGFLPPEFTLADLREAYETILGRRLDPANFRRQVDATRTLVPTNAFRTGSHRPARLYRDATDVELVDRGPLSADETRTIPDRTPADTSRTAETSPS